MYIPVRKPSKLGDQMKFNDMLQAKWDEGKSVCVGLDPDIQELPIYHLHLNEYEIGAIDIWHSVGVASRESAATAILRFNERIIDATHDLVCAYKPNSAFYECLGWNGVRALENTIKYIRRVNPTIPVIYDANRGGTGNVNSGYALSAFDVLNADAITVSPYLGGESLDELLKCTDKGIIILVRTSNSGSDEFQGRSVLGNSTMFEDELYQIVARNIARYWNTNGNCAVVVGATNPSQLKEVRRIVGDMPILIPGIGAQGGDLKKTVLAGVNSKGQGMIINGSYGVIHASPHANFATAAREAVLGMQAQIDEVLQEVSI